MKLSCDHEYEFSSDIDEHEMKCDKCGEPLEVVSSIDLKTLRAELTASKGVETALRVALHDAIEGLEEMFGYVPEYFRDKWGHQEYIDNAKAALTPPTIPRGEAVKFTNEDVAEFDRLVRLMNSLRQTDRISGRMEWSKFEKRFDKPTLNAMWEKIKDKKP